MAERSWHGTILQVRGETERDCVEGSSESIKNDELVVGGLASQRLTDGSPPLEAAVEH